MEQTNQQTNNIDETKTMDSEEIRKIQDFLYDPERTIYQQIDEFKKAIETLVTALSGNKLADIEQIVGENGTDGTTPKRGVDFMNEEDINGLEAFILDKLPKSGIDYPTFTELKKFISDQVAQIPIIKGDPGTPGTPGEPGTNGSPDNGKQILEKLRSLDKNQGLQIRDVRGLGNKITSIDDIIEAIEKRIDDQKVYFSTGISSMVQITKTSELTNDSGFITISDIPFIPTDTSDLTNGAGYITLAEVPGGGDMVLADAQTVTGAKTFNATKLLLRNVANTFNGSFTNTNTADRIYILQNSAGTIAFTSDITGINSGTNTGDNATNTQYSGLVTNATHTGDVTGSGSLTIANSVVGIAKLSATGTPSASNFLRGDNTWAAPAGSGDMVLASAQINSGIKTFLDTTMKLRNVANTFDGSFVNTNTANRIYTLPNAAGTVALTSDITGTNSNTNTGDNATNTQYSGLVTNATHTGDATGATALTVVKINGTLMSGLATGILKNTTITGVPSIAVAGDFPTLNQSTTGSAATLTTPRAINGVNFNGSAAITVADATKLPLAGGTMAGDILGAVSYGSTGTRVTKIWATDLEVTNNPTIGGVKVGYLEIPQNSKSVAYTTVLADSGKHIYHPGADTTARIWTIDSNANVAYPIGTALTFVNDTLGGVITIAITTDTLVLAGAGTTGSRTLAASGVATAIKMTSTRWIISGNGLS